MSSQDPQSSQPSPSAPVKARASNRSLAILAVLLVGAGVAAFAVPEVLKQIYLAEEEAKRKQGPIVGTRTDTKPPPGVSTDPYAGMSGRNADNNAANNPGNEDGEKKASDEEASDK